jgi:hypothetical protein
MKLFRVGSCLALLMAAACTQAPQSVTSPSATAGGSTAATGPDGSTLKVTPPALVSPTDGSRAEDRRPTLIWVNSNGRYGTIGLAYDIELSTTTAVVYSTTVGETPDVGAHIVPMDLEFDTTYSWRVRAHIGNDVGPWSSWASFQTPGRPVAQAPVANPNNPTGGCAAPISPLGPGETRKPRPNDSHIARAVAAQFPAAFAHSCQEHYGAAGWEYLDRAVDALRAHDGRYGYNCKRGICNDPSQDVVSYHYGGASNINGRADVYIIDIIVGHCGPTPSPAWVDVTDATISGGTIGMTIYPRVGRNVTGCTAAGATGGQ